jgi:hypothetical protein
MPIRICGYDHFLQIYWRPNGAEAELQATLRDGAACFKALFDQSLGTTTKVRVMVPLKESLRELFVQMHLAAFQHHVLADLRGRTTEEGLSAGETDRLFYLHAPNLVRMDEMLLPNGEGWYHYMSNRSDGRGPIMDSWVYEQKADESSKIQTKSRPNHIASLKVISGELKVFLPWEEDFDGPLDHLFRGSSEDRLQEQYEWLRRTVRIRREIAGAQRQISDTLSSM